MEEVLKVAPQVADLAKIFTYAHNFIYLGRGYNYPPGHSKARLKLKEISYIHAEGYPAAEMKPRPHCADRRRDAHLAIATPDHTYEKTASNIEEIKARGGKIIAVIARGNATGTPLGRLRDRGPGDRRVPDAHRGIGSAATAGLLHRRLQGPPMSTSPATSPNR